MLGLLAISRALRPVEPPWQVVNVTTVHRAVPVPPQLGPIVPGAGTVIWTPPFPCLVRALTINDDSADPLVGAGGGTSVSIGCNGGGGTVQFVSAISLATYGTALGGWGVFGGSTSSATSAVQDGGLVFAPTGSVPGRAAVLRTIVAFGNAGTITGTLRFRFEMRAFAGPWV